MKPEGPAVMHRSADNDWPAINLLYFKSIAIGHHYN